MKSFIDFLTMRKGLILSLLCLFVGLLIGDSGMLLADATVQAPANDGASAGSEGLSTQQGGQAASVSNLAQTGAASDIIEEEVDDEIAKFMPDFFAFDTIVRKAVQKRMRGNYEVLHYDVDADRIVADTTSAYTANTSTKRTKLLISTEDKDVFPMYSTVEVLGVNGYDETGQIELEGNLMLYVAGVHSDDQLPIVIAINGPKVSSTDLECYIPSIPAGTTLICGINACAESQLFVPPSNSTPVSTKVYMQKKLCNTSVTDYFKNLKKKVDWDEQDIHEQALWEFRRKCEIGYLFGRKGKLLFKDSNRPTTAPEFVYFQQGIWWDINKFYDYIPGSFTYNDLIGITKMKFTGNNGSKIGFFAVGKDLLEDMLKVDYTKYKDLTVVGSTKWGIKMTSFESSFGTLNVVHLPIMDQTGRSQHGMVLDIDYLVRYYMKDNETKKVDMSAQGEESERNITQQIDCLALKGYSHMIVRPSEVSTAASITSNTASLAVAATTAAKASKAIVIKGVGLNAAVSAAVSGTNAALFTIAPASFTPVSGAVLDSIIVTYTPVAAGSHSAVLTVSSQGATDLVINLSGTAAS